MGLAIILPVSSYTIESSVPCSNKLPLWARVEEAI